MAKKQTDTNTSETETLGTTQKKPQEKGKTTWLQKLRFKSIMSAILRSVIGLSVTMIGFLGLLQTLPLITSFLSGLIGVMPDFYQALDGTATDEDMQEALKLTSVDWVAYGTWAITSLVSGAVYAFGYVKVVTLMWSKLFRKPTTDK